MSWLIAMFVKPFFAVAFMLMLYGIKTLILRFIPEGKVRRILLLPIGRKSRDGQVSLKVVGNPPNR